MKFKSTSFAYKSSKDMKGFKICSPNGHQPQITFYVYMNNRQSSA